MSEEVPFVQVSMKPDEVRQILDGYRCWWDQQWDMAAASATRSGHNLIEWRERRAAAKAAFDDLAARMEAAVSGSSPREGQSDG